MSAHQISFIAAAPIRRVKEITVKSPVFINKGMIPRKYTVDGANISPPLVLDEIPDETQSMVLLVEDPDAPLDTWVHWLVWNIYPSTKIYEDTAPGIEGLNAFHKQHYAGPCPSYGTHNYFFKVYALDTVLQIPRNSTKREVMRAVKDHVIGYGSLVGSYNRNTMIHLQYNSQLNAYCYN